MRRRVGWFFLWVVLLTASVVCGEGPGERVAVSGRVVDEQSQGVAGVLVRGFGYSDKPEATTDADGRFVLNVLEERLWSLAIVAQDAGGDRLGVFGPSWENPPEADSFIEIKLAACKNLPVKVTGADGKTAEGVEVSALIGFSPLVSTVTDAGGGAVLKLPAGAEVQSLFAVKPGVGFDYRVVKTPRDTAHRAEWLNEPPVLFQLARSQSFRVRLVFPDDTPIVGTDVSIWLLYKPGEPDSFNLNFTPSLYRVTTDEAGVAEFRGVPDWEIQPLTLWPEKGDSLVHERIIYDPKEHPDGLMTVRLERLVPVTGLVRHADGRPAAGIAVTVSGAGYTMAGFRQATTTDEEGRFEIKVTPNQLYMLAVQDDEWAAPALDGLIVRPGEPLEGLEFVLRPATRVHGRVTVGPGEKPVAGQRMSLRQAGRRLRELEGVELPNPENRPFVVQPSVWRQTSTDGEGRFEFFVGPGSYKLSGPSQVESKEFEVVGESEIVHDFASPRPERGPFSGRVVTGDPPRGVPGAVVSGIYRAMSGGSDLRLRADEEGRFAGERELHPVVLRAESSDGTLAGIVEIGPDDLEATIAIGPLASAMARLIDDETGEALPEKDVQWYRRVPMGDDDAPWRTSWGGTVRTDASGFFEITGLVVGQGYDLSVPQEDRSSRTLSDYTPETAEPVDLGDLRLKPPYKPPTFEERIEGQLAAGSPAGEKYDEALEVAGQMRQNVLVVFVKRGAPLTEGWFKLRLEDNKVRSALFNFRLVQVDTDSEDARALAKRLGVEIDEEKLPVWCFCEPSGEEMAKGVVPRSSEGDALDRVALLERLGRHAPAPLDARELLDEALAEATKSNRRVIVMETATWCGPCHALSRFLERHRSVWEKDYLWVRVDKRWNGSEEVMKKIQEERGGIPWYAILDSGGEVLAKSDGPKGNIGYPIEPEEIEHFMTMLEETKQRLTPEELATLRGDLEE